MPILLVNVAAGGLTYALAWLPARLAFDQSLVDRNALMKVEPTRDRFAHKNSLHATHFAQPYFAIAGFVGAAPLAHT